MTHYYKSSLYFLQHYTTTLIILFPSLSAERRRTVIKSREHVKFHFSLPASRSGKSITTSSSWIARPYILETHSSSHKL
ncbi:hypothetical protein EXN66_Car013494 [Channa argus]|uniref:Uncharacterized protein n=1 Tax=Channa argus TaxID=215402 RepID=A0A6G1Q625_CHAAH|nr:hypothetical protein EXN66_Car013494 [Channa argus]